MLSLWILYAFFKIVYINVINIVQNFVSIKTTLKIKQMSKESTQILIVYSI